MPEDNIDVDVEEDPQWGYGDPAEVNCADIWDIFDLEKLFKLTKEGEKSRKKFSIVSYSYRLEAARLPCISSGETSI